MAVLDRFAWLLLVFLVTAGCRMGPALWGPFRGRIVDAETGAPIPGAHFMVMWERDNPNPVHWTQSFYDAQETVTDAEGRFEIPRQLRLVTLFVRRPVFAAFAPGHVAEAEEMLSSGSPTYVDATILKMRRLESRKELCESRPREPSAPSTSVPEYMRAVQQYNIQLDCLE
jgi:hypothetical protein